MGGRLKGWKEIEEILGWINEKQDVLTKCGGGGGGG